MARKRKRLEDSLRWEIYCEFRRWSEEHNTICNPHSFWKRILPQRGYKMAQGTFQREWERLIYEGLIRLEPMTRTPIITDLRLVDSQIAEEVKRLLLA